MDSYLQQWNKLRLVEDCVRDIDDMIYLEPIWKLDDQLREEFRSILAQHEQGCLHSMEMFEQLQRIVTSQK